MRDDDRVIAALIDEYLRIHPEELAAELDGSSGDELAAVLAGLDPHRGAALLVQLRPDVAAAALPGLGRELRRTLLGIADPSRVARIVGSLDHEQGDEILAQLDPGTAGQLREIMHYPPDTAGSMMDTRVTHFRRETTAADTLARLRELRHLRIAAVHVVDGDDRLIGSVRLQDLALAGPDERLKQLVAGPAVSVQATAPRSEVVELMEQRRLPSIPVVDFDGHLLGVIRQEALFSAVEAEATADIQAMVGASREERALSPVTFAVRKRLPWLEANLATAFLAAAVVGLFEGTIARFTALAVLLPVVAGQSGNTGAQALAVTMRGLALREVRTLQWLIVASKEARVALLNSLAVAATTSAAVLLWSRSPGLALVIGVSMILSMVAAGLAGAVIPMLLTAIGQDPAQSSSIILTTVTDVVGFFSFLGIATALAGIL